MSAIAVERTSGRVHQCTYARKDEEYIADFCLVSHRALDDDEYQIFRFHYLLRADRKLCCRRLGIDIGLYFHMLYRIEAKLGRTFRELQPYGLWPLDAYFGVRSCRMTCSEVPPRIPSGRARRFPPFLLSA